MVIYKTTNLTNKKIYIGQDSKNDPNYLGSGSLIKKAIKKYGRENFIKEIVSFCDTKENLDSLERFYIKVFNSKEPNGYNLADGGNGSLGWKATKETRKRMSESMRGNRNPMRNSESLEKVKGKNNHFYGKHHTEESRNKISRGLRKHPTILCKQCGRETRNPKYCSLKCFRLDIIVGKPGTMLGRYHTKETKQKMRISAIKGAKK